MGKGVSKIRKNCRCRLWMVPMAKLAEGPSINDVTIFLGLEGLKKLIKHSSKSGDM